MVNFDRSPAECDLIGLIAQRALGLPWPRRPGRLSLEMDITAAHCNGMPLNLTALLSADDTNFAHDIGGITQHINRQTGVLENCFVPRYAASNN